MRDELQILDREFAFQASGRFDLLAGEHVAYSTLGAEDVDAALFRSIERAEGVTTVIGRMGSGKSSLIAAVSDSLDEGFLPLRVSVIGVEAGDPAAFARHMIAEIRDIPDASLTQHEQKALDRATAEQRSQSSSRELRVGFQLAAGHVLTAGVVSDIKRAAGEELSRAVDASEVLRGAQKLLDVFWGIGRCPVVLVEDTDHWGGAPDVANSFFDQTARAFANMDVAMVVATQSDYTDLDGYRRLRDRLTAEIVLPCLPNVEHGLTTVLKRRMKAAGVTIPVARLLESQALELLCRSYSDSVANGRAGDLRRTLAVMRAALEVALSEPTAQLITGGHMQEALARTPLMPSSALSP